LLVSWVGGAVTRAWLVGAAVYVAMLIAPGVDVPINNIGVVLFFGTMGSVMLALLGILTGIWADKFDHAAAVTNFVVQPLTLLSGTFYAIDRVSPTMRLISHGNPFFYIIDGFRYGFLGVSDGLALQGAVVLVVIDVALWLLCYRLLSTGWRLKP
ncbi:MAG: ABC transporter permease, partial [Janthinobacterium lividum]